MQGSRQRSIVHIGLHKTGSTSIQKFIWKFRSRFARLGIAVYEGQHICANHVELHVAAMKPERMSPYKHNNNIFGGEAYQMGVERRLRAFTTSSKQSTYLFSAEGLSYLRYQEELEWLKSALPGETTIIAYVRKLDDYVAAYRYELRKNRVQETDDESSVAYVAPDSWLWDYSARLQGFRDAFGHSNVIVLDYDAEMRKNGNIIPSFVKLLRAEASFESKDWEGLFLNRQPRTQNHSDSGAP